jgi:hypothetical protein
MEDREGFYSMLSYESEKCLERIADSLEKLVAMAKQICPPVPSNEKARQEAQTREGMKLRRHALNL